MAKYFISVLLFLSFNGYSQWTDLEMTSFKSFLNQDMKKSRAVIPDYLVEKISDCVLGKCLVKYRKYSDISRYSKEDVRAFVSQAVLDCGNQNEKEIMKTMYLTYDLFTLKWLKEELLESEIFKRINPKLFDEFVLKAYNEIKKVYPKGIPLKEGDKLVEIIIEAINTTKLVKEYSI